MSHALTTRAASLGASALLMTSLVLAALMATYTIRAIGDVPPPGPVVEVLTPPEPPPPTPPNTPPRTPITTTTTDVTPLPPLDPVVTSDPEPSYAAYAQPSTGPMEITAPHWLRRPRDLGAYYPRRAIDRNIEGDALLDCLVTTAGTLQCSVVSETPTGWGFGEAALRIARDHRMAPAMSQGTAVEGHYRMRVPFELRG